MNILLAIIGVLFVSLALWQGDESRRAKGRGRVNDILTDYGGGSFSEFIKSLIAEKAHGCLAQILGLIGLIMLGYVFFYWSWANS